MSSDAEPFSSLLAAWVPTAGFIESTNIAWLMRRVGAATYEELHAWSVQHRAAYSGADHRAVGDPPSIAIQPGRRFFGRIGIAALAGERATQHCRKLPFRPRRQPSHHLSVRAGRNWHGQHRRAAAAYWPGCVESDAEWIPARRSAGDHHADDCRGRGDLSWCRAGWLCGGRDRRQLPAERNCRPIAVGERSGSLHPGYDDSRRQIAAAVCECRRSRLAASDRGRRKRGSVRAVAPAIATGKIFWRTPNA